MTHSVVITPQEHHYWEMEKTLTGFWDRNHWYVKECPLLLTEEWKPNGRNLYWEKYQNEFIRTEMKYYVAQKLLLGHLSLYSVFQNYGRSIHRFAEFINNHLPHIKSIIDIPKVILEKMWKNHLESLNIQISRTKKSWTRIKQNENRDGVYTEPSGIMTFISKFYDFFMDFYDERDEFEKDIWDVRKSGISFNLSKAEEKINFTRVPLQFKDFMKRYIKLRLNQQSTAHSTMLRNLMLLVKFLEFINISYPEWRDLRELSRNDIEKYLQYLRETPMGGTTKNHAFQGPSSKRHIANCITTLNTFIETIQKYDWVEAPSIPVHKLIFSEDRPSIDYSVKDDINHIPDDIWEQVINHIDQFPKQYVPIILVMEASGFRSSDVLSLKLDCLLETNNGWWLVGDQQKVRYKDHKVPISEEIAHIIAAQKKLVENNLTQAENPLSLIFPVFKGSRKGKPVAAKTISQNLNILAQKCNILDANGQLYWFKNHAFRHRYGITLINNGMDITIVQQLMAHTSPEMTAVYAKLLSETKRREWEQARGNGAFPSIRLSQDGNVVHANLDEQAIENGIELEWIRHNFDSIRLDHGFCIKSPKAHCEYLKQTLDPPCIEKSCKSFHVDHTFIAYYEDQINKMENDIVIYKKANRTRSIELLQIKLDRYTGILQGLQNNAGIFGLEKSKREFTGTERVLGKNVAKF
ncbi:integrase [Paenibacillus sp. V4I3]|uniref:tyrosine-type recombinase/integrase n=1 Tax=Paenibacillus sp. V4I3 TaxID=3042305 RepID=UPI0027820CAE|nr:tyrosine-type recombinase/integrase [Paenibacillus sp. V4I3]MDQ0876599.1 integrase [Paenibacillus sp. V4I3]